MTAAQAAAFVSNPTNDIVVPPGAQASSSDAGCEAADFAPASTTEPQVALIQRGTCDFVVKAQNAEAAGYEAPAADASKIEEDNE